MTKQRYHSKKLFTQAGGMNYCIQKIYQINPKATIYFFTSSKAFNDRGAYDPFDAKGMVRYVDMQKKSAPCTAYPI